MLKINLGEIRYNQQIILSDIEINISKNGLYGFFGKNGAGKTTFFNALCGLVSCQGSILYGDDNLNASDIAFVPTEPFVYEYLTTEEFYNFYSYTIAGKKSESEKIFDIEQNKILKECSTGTRKKAYINAVLQFKNYKLYIFDEPFNGLDIESNYVILDEILRLSKENIVFVSSHIIEVVEEYLDAKFLVSDGKIVNIDKNHSIKSYFGNDKNAV